MARVVGHDAVPILSGNLSSVKYEVWNVLDTPHAKVVSETTLTTTTVIFDTLQVDALWTKDATGYNFKADLPAATFPNKKETHSLRDIVYRVEVKFTPSSGEVFFAIYQIQARDIRYGD